MLAAISAFLGASAGLWLQPAPEIMVAQPKVRLILSAATAPTLEFAYRIDWAAGRHRVSWRPPTRRARITEATATLAPSAGKLLPSWNVRGRIGWVVDVPESGTYVLTILAPLTDLDWRLEALARVNDNRLVLHPELIVGNNAAEPLAVDGVTLLDKEGAPVAESEESLLVEAATRVRFPIGQP
ncbi:MAG: hypothetical protein N2512_03370, partial [Armatimonadetes bacterium]|nr:hypothetical protein [Armatimonadota bacterium]